MGNDPLLLPLPLPPLPAFGFWFGPVGNDPFVLLPPPPRAMEPEIGASRATPTVATPSMMLSRFVIIVAPTGSLTSKGYPARLTIASFTVTLRGGGTVVVACGGRHPGNTWIMAGREASVAGALRYLLSALLLVGGVWMLQHSTS